LSLTLAFELHGCIAAIPIAETNHRTVAAMIDFDPEYRLHVAPVNAGIWLRIALFVHTVLFNNENGTVRHYSILEQKPREEYIPEESTN
jgi:hypothetical protein